jgi:signal transduction histidine kinase
MSKYPTAFMGLSSFLLKSMAWRRHICCVAGAISCVLTCFTYQDVSAIEPKRVLLLRYSVGYSDSLARNARGELERQSRADLQIYDALFTTARVDDESALARYADYLGTLFPDQRLDLAVAIGSPAVNFFKRYGRPLFPSTPLLAVAQESRLPRNLGQLETAAATSINLVGAVETIIKVLPETTNISVVIGNSPLEQYWLAKARVEFRPFESRVSFRWLNDLSFDDILKHAAALPPRSAILYINLLSDALGAAYQDHEVVSKLYALAKAPIFTYDDGDFGQGIIGGTLLSAQGASQDIASIALRMLRGEELGGVTISGLGTGATPKFDWREMQHWGISESDLPSGSEIYFRVPTAWEIYRGQIVAIATALLMQMLLIVALFYERHRRRCAEAASREHMSELAHMNRTATAGQLSATIAHEVRQPLAAISANVSAGLRWLTKAPPDLGEARAAFARIVGAVTHANDVIDTIRSMFKKGDGERFALNANALIEEVLALVRSDLQRRTVLVETRLGAGLPEIVANRVQLQQVILNLIANAIEVMASTSDHDHVLRVTSDKQEPSGVLITVEDSGPGIEPENIERIFKPFYTTKPEGMGMGLAICRSIVESHGGRLFATPGRSRGLALHIELPARATVETRNVGAEAADSVSA